MSVFIKKANHWHFDFAANILILPSIASYIPETGVRSLKRVLNPWKKYWMSTIKNLVHNINEGSVRSKSRFATFFLWHWDITHITFGYVSNVKKLFAWHFYKVLTQDHRFLHLLTPLREVLLCTKRGFALHKMSFFSHKKES